jgi:RHS repeat-associated protein
MYRCNGISRDKFGIIGWDSDLVQKIVNGVTTTYVLDLNRPLTQVLSDGTDTYFYGLGRIGEIAGTSWEYHLGDALGSVRQLINSSGAVSFVQTYQPYGEILSSNGEADNSYGFTGEMSGPNGLIYLRTRYVDTASGRFLTRDSKIGDYYRPLSLNRWSYVEANPIMFTDPSGKSAGFEGPLSFAMCFDLHSGTYGRFYGERFGFSVTAGLAVEICKTAYNMNMWNKGMFNFDSGAGLPTTVADLMGWYIYEHGPEHLYFDGKQPLTIELAKSTLIIN